MKEEEERMKDEDRRMKSWELEWIGEENKGFAGNTKLLNFELLSKHDGFNLDPIAQMDRAAVS